MPAKQRRRSDEERAPACSRQQTAGGSEEDSIGRAQLGPIALATQHGEFVAEHNDLEFLELIGAEAQYGELQQAPEHEIAERPEQQATPPGGRGGRPTLRTNTGRAQRSNRVNASHTFASCHRGGAGSGCRIRAESDVNSAHGSVSTLPPRHPLLVTRARGRRGACARPSAPGEGSTRRKGVLRNARMQTYDRADSAHGAYRFPQRTTGTRPRTARPRPKGRSPGRRPPLRPLSLGRYGSRDDAIAVNARQHDNKTRIAICQQAKTC
jgi:hypothetical protein